MYKMIKGCRTSKVLLKGSRLSKLFRCKHALPITIKEGWAHRQKQEPTENSQKS